jgi:hypothetical protein
VADCAVALPVYPGIRLPDHINLLILEYFHPGWDDCIANDAEGDSSDYMDWHFHCNRGVNHAMVDCVQKVDLTAEGNIMKKKIQFALLLTLLAVLILPGTVFAKGLREDKIVFGGTYTLETGQVLDGNLVVFGGSATLEEGSEVQGDVVVFGGTLDAQGEITGSVVGIGGLITIGDAASVQEDIVIFGANLDQALGATVGGNVFNGMTGPLALNFPGEMRVPRFQVSFNPLFEFVWFVLRAFLWAILAVVLVLFLPSQFKQISKTAIQQPLISAGLGLLTVVILPVFLLLLLITLICSPLSLLGALLLAIAWGVGLIALGLELGNRIAGMFKQEWAPALSAGVGTLLLILVLNGLQAVVPCFGWIFPALAGVVGLGAVLLTRFGTQAFPQSEFSAMAPAPVPAAPVVEIPAAKPSVAEEPGEDDLPPAI